MIFPIYTRAAKARTKTGGSRERLNVLQFCSSATVDAFNQQNARSMHRAGDVLGSRPLSRFPVGLALGRISADFHRTRQSGSPPIPALRVSSSRKRGSASTASPTKGGELERSMKSFQFRLNLACFDLCICIRSCIFVQVAWLGSP